MIIYRHFKKFRGSMEMVGKDCYFQCSTQSCFCVGSKVFFQANQIVGFGGLNLCLVILNELIA
jgi:hypothetical protein